MQCLCTNRDLPLRMAAVRQPVDWSLDLPRGGAENQMLAACRRPPCGRRRRRAGAPGSQISHLSPSPLSICRRRPGARSILQDILRLYNFSGPDPAAGQKHLEEQALQIVEGLLDVSYRRVLGRVPTDPARGLCRGVEVTVELDPTKRPCCAACTCSPLRCWSAFPDCTPPATPLRN